MRHTALSRWAIDVLNLFHWFRRVHGRIFPSLARIRKMLLNRCSIRTIKRATRELELAGKIWKDRRYRRSTEYSLTPPEGAQMALEFAAEAMVAPTPDLLASPTSALPVACEKTGTVLVQGATCFNQRAAATRSRENRQCPHLGPTVVKPSLRSQRREVSVPLVVFLRSVHAQRKPVRRQTAYERATERFLREG